MSVATTKILKSDKHGGAEMCQARAPIDLPVEAEVI